MRKAAYILGILAMLVPFAFGVIRAITSGSDFRYVWMALAAVLGAAAVAIPTKQRTQTRNEIFTRSAGAFVLATLLAGGVGYLLGARSFIGVWIVAVSFGLCEAVGFALTKIAGKPGASIA